MHKFFTRVFLLFILSSSTAATSAQIITQWNFNSVIPDANTSTGTLSPSTGSGIIQQVGGTVQSFASGDSNGGSSDPATGDDSGMGLTTFPAQGANNKTAGIEFRVSTVGFQNIEVSFDLRHSNTSSRSAQFQYTTNITATPVVWTDFAVSVATGGDTWFPRSFNLSAVAGLNNNANAAFRVVSAFDGAGSTYAPANSGSAYAAGGTWRFDMVTVRGGGLPPATVSFVNANSTVNENGGTVINVVARLLNGGPAPVTVDLELLNSSTAAAGSDYVLPGSMQFSWPANSTNVDATIQFSITDDALAENTEYIAARLKNPVNVTLPAASANHFTGFITDNDKQAPAALNTIELNPFASFSNGAAGTNSAEIVAHDPGTQRLFIANSIGAKLDIVNFANPAAPVLISSIPMAPYGNINSVAVRNGLVALAVENAAPQSPGTIVFMNTNGGFISQVDAGAMPDMITFTPDGTKVITANEGEPNAAYTIDPEGSITVVDISGGAATVTNANVTNIGFTSFNSPAQVTALRNAGVRLFGPGATVSQDIEPEYVTVSADNQTAYVTCQENNAIAVVNLTTNTVTEIRALGTKNHALPENPLDMSDASTDIQIANWPVRGLYMPDAIASYNVAGQTYLVTANEGDAREYSGYSEIVRLSAATYNLDPAVFPDAAFLKANLGRLNVTTASGDTDLDGDFDEIHVFGSRSFSIWNATTGALVYDSKDDFEQITAKHPQFGAIFNASNANNTRKNRSDDKGPEPEGVAVAQIGGRSFAFIALERIGGVMVYDITDPVTPVFVDYKNTRNTAAYGGDNGAEGVVYIPAAQSPTAMPLVILANEVSSTLSIYGITTGVLAIDDVAPAVRPRTERQADFAVIAPNPVLNDLNIQFAELPAGNANIRLVDMQGRTVGMQTVKGRRVTMDVSALAPGVYAVEFTSIGMKRTMQFVKR